MNIKLLSSSNFYSYIQKKLIFDIIGIKTVYNSYKSYFYFIFSKMKNTSSNWFPFLSKQWNYIRDTFYKKKYYNIFNNFLLNYLVSFCSFKLSVQSSLNRYFFKTFIEIYNIVSFSLKNFNLIVSNTNFLLSFFDRYFLSSFFFSNYVYYFLNSAVDIMFSFIAVSGLDNALVSWWVSSMHLVFEISYINWITELTFSTNWSLTIALLLSSKDYFWLLKQLIYFFQRFNKIRRGYMYLKTTRTNTFISFNTVLPLTDSGNYIFSFGDVPESSNLTSAHRNIFSTFNKYHTELVQNRVLKTWSCGTIGFSRKSRRSPKAVIVLRSLVLAFLDEFFRNTKLDYFTLYINGNFGIMKPFYKMIRHYLTSQFWILKKSFNFYKRNWSIVTKFLSKFKNVNLFSSIQTLFDYYSYLSELKRLDTDSTKISSKNSTAKADSTDSLYSITQSETVVNLGTSKSDLNSTETVINLGTSKSDLNSTETASNLGTLKSDLNFEDSNLVTNQIFYIFYSFNNSLSDFDRAKFIKSELFIKPYLLKNLLSNHLYKGPFNILISKSIDRINSDIKCLSRIPASIPISKVRNQTTKKNYKNKNSKSSKNEIPDFPITDAMKEVLSEYFPLDYQSKKNLTSNIPVKKVFLPNNQLDSSSIIVNNLESPSSIASRNINSTFLATVETIFTANALNLFKDVMYTNCLDVPYIHLISPPKPGETYSQFIVRFADNISFVESDKDVKNLKLPEIVQARVKMLELILYLPRSYFIQDLTTYPFNGCRRVRRYCKSKSKSQIAIY